MMFRAFGKTTEVGGAKASARRLLFAVLVVVVLSVVIGEDGFWVRIASIGAITYILAGSYNLIFGYGGLFALAHVSLYGIGSYASVILIAKFGFPFLVAASCAIALTCAASWLLWILTQRLNDVFFAVGTLAFGIAIGEVLNSWVGLTGGPSGYLGIPPLSVGGFTIFGGSSGYMWLCLGIAVLCFEMMFRVSHSPMGQFFVALREDETLLRSIAVRPEVVRRNAFLISAFFAGLAGVLYAHLTMFISPESFSLHVMVTVLIITLVGGAGTTLGPLVAVIVFIIIDELGHRLGDANTLLLGIMIVFMIAVAPSGLVGLFQNWRRQRVARASRKNGSSRAGDGPIDTESVLCERESAIDVRQKPPADKARRELKISGVTIEFGGVKALSDVGFSIQSGQTVGLIGPNGAGKTSLVNAITGFVRAQAGTVTLDGLELTGLSPEKVVTAGVVRTFQTTRLVPTLDLVTNVALAQYRHKSSGGASDFLLLSRTRRDVARARSRAAELLDLVGLTDEQTTLASDLSYGVLRRAEVAKAMALDPAFILLDEPGAGLSAHEHDEVATAVRSVVATGVGCLLIDHNMSFVSSVCETAVVLVAGSVLAEGTIADVMRRTEVVEAYLGEGVSR